MDVAGADSARSIQSDVRLPAAAASPRARKDHGARRARAGGRLPASGSIAALVRRRLLRLSERRARLAAGQALADGIFTRGVFLRLVVRWTNGFAHAGSVSERNGQPAAFRHSAAARPAMSAAVSDCPARPRRAAKNAARSIGLVHMSSQPAARHLSCSAPRAWAVNAKMGRR